jgi:hypothetical protein
MRALKVLVVVMGVVLVLGTAALVAAILHRAGRPPATTEQPVAGGAVAVELPAGAHIISSELSDDRVLVQVALADGSVELLLFDARSGARVATIMLQPRAVP